MLTCYKIFRNRGLIQYFSPYISADLHKMAESFNTNVANLENELMKLILDGSIKVNTFLDNLRISCDKFWQVLLINY